ncbi:hypothetical protein [Streptomyces sp. SID13726]|uniref:hypothetical protein n=1 Tax=Streptomyces sp. SID13726 TaxID=2706058 RepID=UPI0013B61E1B|nr:hypothetical protein [Streptomyces sp. SID13726]NEB03061.1 hypothetical protein [Streptomyces sp. SID13726]
MGVPGELTAEVERVDELLRSVSLREVDMRDPDWMAKVSAAPHPLDEAHVRAEAETGLRALLACYDQGDEPTRAAVRALLNRCSDFSAVTGLPSRPVSGDSLRRELLHLSARDHGKDTRDEMVLLNDLCAQARDAGVDIRPLLLEVAALSSDEDKYGMGSVRDILRRAADRDPAGLW